MFSLLGVERRKDMVLLFSSFILRKFQFSTFIISCNSIRCFGKVLVNGIIYLNSYEFIFSAVFEV